MFWGLKLENNKAYVNPCADPFRITSAVLDISSADNVPVQVGMKHKDVNYVICTLNKEKGLYQVQLDLQFESEDELSFFKTGGKGNVHLLGYQVSEEDEDDDSYLGDEAEVDVEAEAPPALIPIKRKKDFETASAKKKPRLSNISEEGTPTAKKGTPLKKEAAEAKQTKSKKQKANQKKDLSFSDLMKGDIEEDSDDEDFFGDEAAEEAEEEESSEDELEVTNLEEEEDDDEGDEEEEEEDDDEEEEEDDSEGEEEEEEEEDEEMEVEVKPKKSAFTPDSSKKQKEKQILNEKSKKLLTPATINGTTPKSERKDKSKTPVSLSKGNKENYKHQDTPKPPKKLPSKETPSSQKKMKTVKQGGVTCEDIEVGSGAEAKQGSLVSVYYEGRLRKSGKLFDKKVTGEPFNFRLGKAEVIKGWDVAIDGMRVGGKRTICIPPHMAYGKKGAPPDIPPHSPLVFQVELKDVKK